MQTQMTQTYDDAPLRRRTNTVLQIGFRVSAALIVIGIVVAVLKQEPLPNTLGSPRVLFRALLNGEPGGIIGLGILSVILTPFVSTVVIVLAFLQSGDRRYARIGAIVLAVLCIAVIVSLVV
jgi:uncharacterized membrane protein